MFKIYSSSAGSGKTYTLTKEYLKLALGNQLDPISGEVGFSAFYFKRILAVTFTKAATHEMKERIMGALQAFGDINSQRKAAKSRGEAAPETPFLLLDIIAELYPDDLENTEAHIYELSERARKTFGCIIHDYSDFAVMTIDGFVQKIVSAFTDELELPFTFEVEMDVELLRTAVDKLLERVGNEQHQQLTEVLEQYYQDESEEGQGWMKIPERLADFARDLLNEQHYEAIKKIDELEPTDFTRIRADLRAFNKNILGQITALSSDALGVIDDAGLEKESFSYGDAFNFFDQRLSEIKIMEVPKPRIKACFEDNKWYTKTASSDLKNKIEGIKSQLVDYYEQINSIRERKGQQYLLNKAVIPSLHNISLLTQIKKEFDGLLRENNRVHISDFNRRILKIVSEEPVPFIYERMGERYNHILIDEFQDTSRLQLANLLPLIDNSLAMEHFNMAVGDSKQAIYRWRGGDMEQIVALHKRDLKRISGSFSDSVWNMERLVAVGQHISPAALNTNRRSAGEIIGFNNALFSFFAERFKEQFAGVKDVFDENFAQEIPNAAPTGGHVQLNFLPDIKDENLPKMVSETIRIVENALAQGFQFGDIAILCRKKSHAKAIANVLKENNFPLISEDSLSLRFSDSVNLLIAFMRVLRSPEDKLAKYEALYLFYRIIKKQSPCGDLNVQIKAAVESYDVQVFYDHLNKQAINGQPIHIEPFKLLQLNVYELCERLITGFSLFDFAQEKDFLFRFLDEVLTFGNRNTNHLGDFLDYWDIKQESVSISAPTRADAITVQTIHKSKGLEYPVVIIPFADWSYEPRGTVWVDLPDPNYGLKAASVKVGKGLLETSVCLQYKSELEKTFVENLNLLYVALTRPTQQLHILVQEKDYMSDKYRKNIGCLFYEYLSHKRIWKTGGNEYVICDGNSTLHPRRGTAKAPDVLKIPKVISADRSQKLHLRRLAERVFDVETFEKKKDLGNKVHYAFAEIKSHKDVDKALDKLLNSGIIEPQERESLRESIESVLKMPELQGLFDEDVLVYNEKDILVSDPEVEIFRADRVVILDDRVVILDYKTGVPKPEHKRQISRYANLYRQMDYENVVPMLVYLEEGRVERV